MLAMAPAGSVVHQIVEAIRIQADLDTNARKSSGLSLTEERLQVERQQQYLRAVGVLS